MRGGEAGKGGQNMGREEVNTVNVTLYSFGNLRVLRISVKKRI